MKVIKKNNFPNIFPMRIKCERVVDKYGFSYGQQNDFCGSILEIEPKDIKKHKWHKYPDYKGVDYGVICPVCGKFIAINEQLIPKHILNNTQEVQLYTHNGVFCFAVDK